MVKSRYSILFPTSFLWTLLGNSRCVNSFPNKWGCMKAFKCARGREKNREKRRLTCPGDRKNNSIFYYAGRENRKRTRDGVKQSRCLCGGREEGRVRVISGSCERLVLTRNCSRCLSDSGVNSVDMGMTSPARIMIALGEEGTDKTKVFTSAAPAGLQAA